MAPPNALGRSRWFHARAGGLLGTAEGKAPVLHPSPVTAPYPRLEKKSDHRSAENGVTRPVLCDVTTPYNLQDFLPVCVFHRLMDLKEFIPLPDSARDDYGHEGHDDNCHGCQQIELLG